VSKIFTSIIFLAIVINAGTLRVHNVKMDSSLTVNRISGVPALDSIFGIQNGSRVMKACPLPLGSDSVRAAGTSDTALNTPDHNVDIPFIPASDGSPLWKESVLQNDDDGSPGGIAGLTLPYNRVYYFKIPNDTAELHIGAEGYGGAYLNLYGQYSCCDGSFYLSGPGGGLSEIWAHNLKLNSDSSIYSVSSKINRLASDSLIQLNFDTLKLMANGDHAARVKFGGVGYPSVVPAIAMTDSIPILQGNGLLGRISGSSFRTGIGAISSTIVADSNLVKVMKGTPKRIPVFKSGNRIDTSGIIYDTTTNKSYFPSSIYIGDTTNYIPVNIGTMGTVTDRDTDFQTILLSATGQGYSSRGSFMWLFGNENSGEAILSSGDSGDLHLTSPSDSNVITVRGGTIDFDVPDTCYVDNVDLQISRDPLDPFDQNRVCIQPVRSDSQVLRIYGAGPNPGGNIKCDIELNRGNISVAGDTMRVSTWTEFQSSVKVYSLAFGESTIINDVTIDGDSLEITSGDTIRIYMPVVKRHTPIP
jgi:hypothetical protein